MSKVTRDMERLVSCLKKSKAKYMERRENVSNVYYFFPDVNNTGWHEQIVKQCISDGLVDLVSMDDAGIQLARVKLFPEGAKK